MTTSARCEPTGLEGVWECYPSTNFSDERGRYVETWNLHQYKQAMRALWDKLYPFPSLYNLLWQNIEWVQDDISVSGQGVLRGIHGDTRTWKLVSCLEGEFCLIVVNNRKGTEDYLRWIGFVLRESEPRQILIPPGFGNGHLVLSKRAIFHYKQSTYYKGADHQFSLRWDDPELNIFWPLLPGQQPILSQRDAEAEYV